MKRNMRSLWVRRFCINEYVSICVFICMYIDIYSRPVVDNLYNVFYNISADETEHASLWVHRFCIYEYVNICVFICVYKDFYIRPVVDNL
jgi:hypothetical protein